MQNQIPPLILTFGALDPVAATGLSADLASFVAMGCQGLPVATCVLVGDTMQIDESHAIDAETVVDQARTLLEDMPVAAFKVGLAGSVETVSVIAEIVSDYPDLPLILDPFSTSFSDGGPDAEDMMLAVRELLIPQCTLLLISETELSRLAETWKDEDTPDNRDADIKTLLDSGCKYVFVTGTPAEEGEVANTLYDERGVVRNDHWQRLSGSFVGAGNTLSSCIAALAGSGEDMALAVLEAQQFTLNALTHAQRRGMGKLIPDHYFWTRSAQE